MKIFMTGASGFIGRAITAKLLEEKHEIIAATRGNSNLPPGVKPTIVDITRPESFGSAGEGADILIHLASLITFDPTRLDDLMRINAEGTRNTLDAAVRWGVKKVLVTSSACTIGISKGPLPLDEKNVPSESLVQRNPYMKSKLKCEKIAFEMSSKLPLVIVNPTSVFGPGDKTLNSGTLVIKVYKSKILPVPSGGSNVVNIDDVARGFILAAKHGRPGERYILGGENILFSQIFSTIAEVTGSRPLSVPLPHHARMPMSAAAWLIGKMTGDRFMTPQIIGDLFDYKYYSSEKAKAELGWEPVKSFAESVSTAWKYYIENGLVK